MLTSPVSADRRILDFTFDRTMLLEVDSFTELREIDFVIFDCHELRHSERLLILVLGLELRKASLFLEEPIERRVQVLQLLLERLTVGIADPGQFLLE